MTQREIVISREPVHSEIDENGRLRLYMCLWNDDSEIPLDSRANEKGKHGAWFDIEDKKIVDLYKKELEKCIKRLDEIQFWEGK
jgi:hypothetical protein